MIWHSSVLIGCAATICPPFGPFNIPWHFYVCNYITGYIKKKLKNQINKYRDIL